jgi:formylglycine-generating enzyme required for sulfatase activity
MSEQVILPAPFDLIEIPRGSVTLLWIWDDNLKKDEPQTFEVSTFTIAKYPVTNAQFAKFIDAKGYQNDNWWTADGLKVKQSEKWKEPHYWQDNKWNGATQPVIGVSWYEAIAFCLWLSAETGNNIVLPTEQQWQRAAQGDDGRIYPWGNDWDGSRCNNNVDKKGSGKTTRVTQYEGKGDSFFGVVDMAGNVGEWCRTAYETGSQELNGTDVRVLRGGSWVNFYTADFRCVDRSYDFPYYRSYDRSYDHGFRFVISY